jgi:hypothetical protein
MTHGIVVPIPRRCAGCNGTIPTHRHRSARYCNDACRMDAARARRSGLPQAIPLSTQAHRVPTKIAALAPLLLLVGLLAGIALAFGYGQFMGEETHSAGLEEQVVKLRKVSAHRFEDQLNGHFWLRQCNQHSPLCAGYIAGFTRLNSVLAYPFFCLGDLRIAEVESLVAKELRHLNRLSPVLLDYPMSALMLSTLERWFPCNTMVG